MLLALLEAAYCIVAWRYLSLLDGKVARPWGQSFCAFTPYMTVLFGELTMDVANQRPRWLVRLQRVNVVLTTVFACGAFIDMMWNTSITIRPTIITDLASLHRHRLIFTPLGSAYLAWVSLAFVCFAVTSFRGYRKERDLLPMVAGCAIYFVATVLDFGIVEGFRDGIFIQHFGFFTLVIGCWRVLSTRFGKMQHAIERLEQQRDRLLITGPIIHKQKLDSLGTLASSVAHEINDPIQGIMNYALLVKRGVDPTSPASEFADEIAGESKRVADIARNLLGAGQATPGATEAADIGEIVEGTLKLVRPNLPADDVELRLRIEEDLPKIRCCAPQLQQVLMNLVTNARDAIRTRDAGRNDAKRITIDVSRRARGDGPWLHLQVSDSGDGVDPALSARIFDAFFTTKGADGTGLGLAVSQGIVKMHGGTIRCESEPGRGARFIVELPCQPPSLLPEPQAPRREIGSVART
jgi:signal transduction histidine kinase